MPLSLSLLGPPDIKVDGTPLQVDTRKAVAILCYLAVEGGEHPRDRFVDLLWPDTEVDRARSSLRRTLSALRSALGGRWVEADRSFVTLDRADLTLDLETLVRLGEAHREHDASTTCPTCIEDLNRAAALHRGRFLDGFDVRDAAPFEMWSMTHDERVRRQLDEVYVRLANAHASVGAYEPAALAADQRLMLDPLREDAYRSLMLYRAWAGDRSGAIDVYRRAVANLQNELGVAPLDETTELYEAILEEDLPRAPAPARRVVTPRQVTLGALPLVGRDRELSNALGALEPGGDGILVVTGSPGFGVTRFLDEVLTDAGGRGATVLSATGSTSTSTVPYGVIHDALFESLSSANAMPAIRALPEAILVEASRIFPGLHPGAPPAPDLTTRTRILDAILQIIGALDRPVLAIDDAHRSDVASAEAIGFIASRAKRLGIRIVVGIARDEAPADSAVEAVLTDLTRRATVVTLGPLDSADVAALAHASGASIDPAVVLRQTGGIPLFVIESLRAAGTGGVPDEITRMVMHQISRLDAAARQVLDAVVVLGRPGDPGVISAISGRSPDETDDALDTLVARGLVTEAEDGTIRPGHDHLTATVRTRMTAARTRLLNRRAAAALHARASGPGASATIAAHHLLAGDDAKAAEWFLRAGDEAVALQAHSEAVTHYEAALAAGHVERGEIHGRIGHSSMLQGAYDRAIVAFETALASGAVDEAGTEHRLGEIYRRLRRWELAAAHYDRAESRADSDELRAVITADRAYVEFQRAGSAAAAPLVERALQLATGSASDRAIARAENVAGITTVDMSTRARHLEAALEHATETGELIAVLNNLAADSTRPDAVDLARRALALAIEVGDRHLTAAIHNTLADALHAAGRPEESLAALTEAVGLFSEVTATAEDPWTPEVWLLTEW